MKRRRTKIILIIVGILFCAAGVITLFFNVPGLKTKMEFDVAATDLIAEADHQEDVFMEEDIAGLPVPVQRYFKYCGYIGSQKMQRCLVTEYLSAVFSTSMKPVKCCLSKPTTDRRSHPTTQAKKSDGLWFLMIIWK